MAKDYAKMGVKRKKEREDDTTTPQLEAFLMKERDCRPGNWKSRILLKLKIIILRRKSSRKGRQRLRLVTDMEESK